MRSEFIARLAVLFLSLPIAGVSYAETGVTDQTVILGQSIALTGSLADLGNEYRNGADLFFTAVNAQGGVHGRKIKLVSLDDGYDTARAVENTKKLINEEKVFAVFGQFGTGITEATVPMTTAQRIPLFAPYTGANALRDNDNRYLFHIRATYGEETDKIVEHLVTVGVQSIALVYQNDNFGLAGYRAAEEALRKRNVKPVAAGVVESATVDVKKAVEDVSKAKPQAVMLITAGKAGIAFIREYNKTGELTQYYALSVVSSRQLLKELGDEAHGIAITQVLPSPWRSSHPIVQEYQQLIAKQRGDDYSYTSFEGFVAAKVFVEALRRAGRNLTRDRLISTLESMQNFDAGGVLLDFRAKKHSGSSYVDLSIISKDGKFLR